MYDVVHRDRRNHLTLVATGLARDAARDFACREAKRRGIGRMFLAGSEPSPERELILIVETRRAA